MLGLQLNHVSKWGHWCRFALVVARIRKPKHSKHSSLHTKQLYTYTIQKLWNICKARSKYLTFWFARNGTDSFNATLTCSVMDENWNLHCFKFKINNRIYSNVSFLILRLKFPPPSRVSIIALWIYGIFVCVRYKNHAKFRTVAW